MLLDYYLPCLLHALSRPHSKHFLNKPRNTIKNCIYRHFPLRKTPTRFRLLSRGTLIADQFLPKRLSNMNRDIFYLFVIGLLIVDEVGR